jgi:hypothetical protein
MLGGARMQDAHWRELVRRVVTLSGGMSGEPRFEKQRVHGAAAQRIDAWIRDLVARRHARSASAPWHEAPLSLTQVLSFEPLTARHARAEASNRSMERSEKLRILADSAKHDASCASRGVTRRAVAGGLLDDLRLTAAA